MLLDVVHGVVVLLVVREVDEDDGVLLVHGVEEDDGTLLVVEDGVHDEVVLVLLVLLLGEVVADQPDSPLWTTLAKPWPARAKRTTENLTIADGV